MKTPFIYLYGPDGAGKTTHAKIITYYLMRLGYPTKYANVKFHHMLSYIILRLLYRSNNSEWYKGFPPPLRKRIRSPWKILELMSIIPAIFFRVLLFIILGYVVVCDRFVIDTLVTLSYFLRDKKILKGWYAKSLIRFIPKNAGVIHLDANVETLLERKKDEPLTTGIVEYYKIAYTAYTKYLKELGYKVMEIRTDRKSITEVTQVYIPIIIRVDR
ncbi:hypothetical protein DRN63_03855 [Nanoarchaeota archaeon]|nr:MAG: hypothetical protein DRN63_03855 [Nanoarchaeota archaeon]